MSHTLPNFIHASIFSNYVQLSPYLDSRTEEDEIPSTNSCVLVVN